MGGRLVPHLLSSCSSLPACATSASQAFFSHRLCQSLGKHVSHQIDTICHLSAQVRHSGFWTVWIQCHSQGIKESHKEWETDKLVLFLLPISVAWLTAWEIYFDRKIRGFRFSKCKNLNNFCRSYFFLFLVYVMIQSLITRSLLSTRFLPLGCKATMTVLDIWEIPVSWQCLGRDHDNTHTAFTKEMQPRTWQVILASLKSGMMSSKGERVTEQGKQQDDEQQQQALLY